MVSIQKHHQYHTVTLYDAKAFQADINAQLARTEQPLSCGASELQHQINRGSVTQQHLVWASGQHA